MPTSGDQFYADNESTAEPISSDADLSIAYQLKFDPPSEADWDNQSVVFYCQDCEKLVRADKDQNALRFTCTECGGRSISFGTQRSLTNFFHLNEDGRRERK
jgi:DNA-directed RNA polymerase subunit RPC12/RpoP